MTEVQAPVVDPPVRGIGPLLRASVLVAFVAAVVGTVTEGSVSRAFGGVAVFTVTAAPLLRVLLLSVAWWHRHDRRYALLGLGLLAVVGAGAGVAILR